MGLSVGGIGLTTLPLALGPSFDAHRSVGAVDRQYPTARSAIADTSPGIKTIKCMTARVGSARAGSGLATPHYAGPCPVLP